MADIDKLTKKGTNDFVDGYVDHLIGGKHSECKVAVRAELEH